MAHRKSKLPHDDTEKLHEEFEKLRGDFTSLARALKSYAEHEERILGDQTEDRVVALREASAHQLDVAKRYATEGARMAETTLREHPGYAVAGAAALGFLVGAFTLRRR